MDGSWTICVFYFSLPFCWSVSLYLAPMDWRLGFAWESNTINDVTHSTVSLHFPTFNLTFYHFNILDP